MYVNNAGVSNPCTCIIYGSSEAANAQSVAHYKCAKQRHTAKEIAEQEVRDKEVVR